jgi:hypothetical protein
MSIADYCAAMDRHEIVVNRDYQRSDQVWPDSARSYLIESILLGYPIPKFYLHFIADVKNRKTIKEIVDGQQRSRAIHDYYHNKFAISNTVDTAEIRGLNYSSLSEDWQARFMTYPLSIDQFIGATPDEVREVFRRMNSYTVPLNPEEFRNASNQGEFKWFIAHLASDYSSILRRLGVLSIKSIIRMQDFKLYTEICHALDYGITTTSRKSLDTIYKKYDARFPQQQEMVSVLRFAFDYLSRMTYLEGTPLAKHYQIYSLVLALAHTKSPVPGEGTVAIGPLDDRKLEVNLMELAAALDPGEPPSGGDKFRGFIEASAERTNVKDQRRARFHAFARALELSQS